MKTMIPPQVGMRLRTLRKEKKGKAKKEKGQKEEEKDRPKKKRKERKNKMREKERRDNATISFSTLVLQNSTMIFMIERVSYMVTFIY